MIGRLGDWSWLNPVQAGSDLSASILNWWNTPTPASPIGPSDAGMTPTQVVQSPDFQVPVRIERPVVPVQPDIPGALPSDYRNNPYSSHPIQAPSFYREGWPMWAWWALGFGVFALVFGGGAGFVALRRRRRARR